MSMAKDGRLCFATLPDSFKKQKPCQSAQKYLTLVTTDYV